MAILNSKYFETELLNSVEEETIEIDAKVFEKSATIMECTLQSVLENEMNWNSIHKAIAISELTYFVEEGKEENYSGSGKIERMKNTIIGYLKRIGAKIMGLIDKAAETIQTMLNKAMSKANIEKDKELIELGIKNIKDETLEGYDMKVTSVTSLFNTVASVINGFNGKSAENLKGVEEGSIQKIIKIITGSDDASAEGIKSKIYGPKVNLLKSKYASYSYISNAFKDFSASVDKLKKTKKDVAKTLTTAIKVCTDAAKGSDNDDQAKELNEKGKVIGSILNTTTMICGVLLKAITDDFMQARQVERKLVAIGASVKAASKTGNTKKKESTSESMIEGVQLI